MKRIYLDYNATAPLRPEALEAFHWALARDAGNPSSVHTGGRAARALVDEARERVAAALEVREEDVVFTSGGTEGLNLAIRGAMRRLPRGSSLVCARTEHAAALGACAQAAEEGAAQTMLEVNALGQIQVEEHRTDLSAAQLVVASSANGETGTLHDLSALRSTMDATKDRAILCVDGVQSLGREPLNWLKNCADLAVFSAHKVGGPQGVGVLWRRGGVSLEPLAFGGGQEGELRPGTENVAAIHAASVAIELAVNELSTEASRQRSLLATCWRSLLEAVPGVQLNGLAPEDPRRLPNTLNVALPRTEGRILVTRLDLEGLAVSAGSACASGSLEASHVLLAMGQSEERARAGLRISLGRGSSEQDIHATVDILRKTIR